MDLTPERLELLALSSLRTVKDVRHAQQAGVDEYSFQVDAHVRVWEYLVDRASRDDELTHADVSALCGVDLLDEVTDDDALVEALVQASVARRARSFVIERLENVGIDPRKRPVEAVERLVGDLSGLLAPATRAHARFFDSDAGSRLSEVLARAERRAAGEWVGWPTGLPAFDDSEGELAPGEVLTVMGSPNVGKSFFMLFMAAYAYWFAGAKVLFLSPESTIFDVETRLDPIVARFMGLELSNRALRSGRVDADVYRDYVAKLGAQKRDEWITRDSGDAGIFTIADVIAQAREHRPDILVIDGFHLIRGEGKSWEAIKSAAETVKGVAQSLGISVLAGTQAQRNAVLAPDDAPRMGEAAYGMGLIEATNRLVSLATRRGNQQHRTFKVQKNRDGVVEGQSFYLNFDVDVGDIRQIDPREDNGLIYFKEN